MEEQVFVLDGSELKNIDDFFDELTRVLKLNKGWGRNMDALQDVLCGAMGGPAGAFRLRWTHSSESKQSLGHAAYAAVLQKRLRECDKSWHSEITAQLHNAKAGNGPTLFHYLTETIAGQDHIQLELT